MKAPHNYAIWLPLSLLVISQHVRGELSISVGQDFLAPFTYSSSTEINLGGNIGAYVGIGNFPPLPYNPYPNLNFVIAPGLEASLYDFTLRGVLLEGTNAGQEFFNAEWVAGVNTTCITKFIANPFDCTTGSNGVFSPSTGYSVGRYRLDVSVTRLNLKLTTPLAPGVYSNVFGTAVTTSREQLEVVNVQPFDIVVEDRTCTMTPIENLFVGSLRKGETKTNNVNMFFDCDSAPFGASWTFSERDNIALSGVTIELLDNNGNPLTSGILYSDLEILNDLTVRTMASSSSSVGQFSKSFLFTVNYL
ncbi:hypothetical protein D8S93_23565 [Vibrio sp. VGrn 2]|uniref:hypothetical protein n=1 Tax=Vibrio sp. VGrn 2 TaxID=2419839 RepID=UPI00128B6028|nr:hypothetical protein [Vibrio sp. VGrn 2]MPS41560.1 hypothetical protein [Vibrio sp. VGrn 2]